MSNKSPKNVFIYPGTYLETTRRDANGLDVRGLIREELRLNGYPTNNCFDKNCIQPDICDLIISCGGAGEPLNSYNGITGTGIGGDLFKLGGDLNENTVIDTSGFDFEVLNDNTKLEFTQAALPLGAGPSTRLFGANGLTTAELGIYQTGSGVPSVGQRTYNTGTDFYTWIRHDTTLEQLTIRSGLTVETGFFTVTMDKNEIIIGREDTNSIVLRVERKTFDDGSFVVSLEGLPTYTNEAHAISAGLTSNNLYKVDAGDAFVVGIVA